MQEFDVQLTVQRALEKYPLAKPRLITDNGSQFISPAAAGRDFNTSELQLLIRRATARLSGITEPFTKNV